MPWLADYAADLTAAVVAAAAVTALRKPSVVGGLTESCFDDRRTVHTGLFPQPPGYLVLTDARGLSLLAGFPVDHCQTVHPDAVAAFDGLPRRLVEVRTFH